MADTLRILRGLYADLPTLAVAEPALTTDTFQIWIGTSAGNIPLGNTDTIIATYKYTPMVLDTNNYLFSLHTTWNGDNSYGAIRFYDATANNYRDIEIILKNGGGVNICDVHTVARSGGVDVNAEIRYMNRVGDLETTDFFITRTGTMSHGQFVEVQSKQLIFDSGNAQQTALTGVTLNDPTSVFDTLNVDTINEKTTGAGVTIKDIRSRDIKAFVDTDALILQGGLTDAPEIRLFGAEHANPGIAGSLYMYVTNAAGDGKVTAVEIHKSDTPSVDIQHTLKTDTIMENTTGTGITIEDVLLKDGDVDVGANKLATTHMCVVQDTGQTNYIDVREKVSGTLGGVNAGRFYASDMMITSTIADIGGAGVTIDGCLIKDGVAGSGETPKLFIPPGAAQHAHSGFGGDNVAKLQDAFYYPILEFDETEWQRARFSFMVPEDYSSGGTIKLSYINTGSGGNNTVVISLNALSRALDETYNSGGSSDENNAIIMTNNDQITAWTASGISLTYTKGDCVGVRVTRETAHASDGFTQKFKVMGIQFEYTK